MLTKEEKRRLKAFRKWGWLVYFPLMLGPAYFFYWGYAGETLDLRVSLALKQDIIYLYGGGFYLIGGVVFMLFLTALPFFYFCPRCDFFRRYIGRIFLVVIAISAVTAVSSQIYVRLQLSGAGYARCGTDFRERHGMTPLLPRGAFYGREAGACDKTYSVDRIDRFRDASYYLYHAPPDERIIPPPDFPLDLVPED